ncbi:MAG: F0F1 ATP synthase subunit delta [Pseudomonadota bacterium]
MSEPASLSSGIAERYATAVFELVKDDQSLPKLEADVAALTAAMADSDDLNAMISSPVYSRDDQKSAIMAVSTAMDVSPTLANTLGLMATKRRLFVLPQLLSALTRRIADEKGEVTAEVTSAKPLTKAQEEKLAQTLKASVGKDVRISTSVDESLIGGLVVKVGSRMIDASLRSRLGALQNTMKEVG